MTNGMFITHNFFNVGSNLKAAIYFDGKLIKRSQQIYSIVNSCPSALPQTEGRLDVYVRYSMGGFRISLWGP
jgi:hypothetical protein